jgi:polar amino acid transport system substrate-binding protein
VKYFLLLSLSLLFGGEALAEKELRWAADTESGAPFVYQDPKNPDRLLGFEKEIIETVAKKIKRTPVLVTNQWDGLVPGLTQGNYDVIINGVEITEERKREISFSSPYYLTFEQLVVQKDTQNIHSLKDAQGKKVGTLKFSLAERIVQNFGGITSSSYEADTHALEDLQNQRIDAVLLDSPIATYYAIPNSSLKLVGEPIGQVLYGIGVRKSDPELLKSINQALEEMRKSGELRGILDRYGLWNARMSEHLADYPKNRDAIHQPTEYEYFLETSRPERTMRERLDLYISFLPLLLKGAMMTLAISLVAMLLAVSVGLILALMRLYGSKLTSFAALLYIEVIRGTPLLIQLFFIFYGLPYLGIKLSPFFAAVLGLGLNYAAYEAENYRAGISSVSKAQTEAGYALGMNRRQTVRYIVIPQALRIVIPPITNDFISLLKDSSLVSVITMVELTKIYGQLASTYYDFFGTGILVAAFYLLLGLPFVRLARYVENRLHASVPILKGAKRIF